MRLIDADALREVLETTVPITPITQQYKKEDVIRAIMDAPTTEKEAKDVWNIRYPDCEHAEWDGTGCLGYCGCTQDDEPIEACKRCRKYTGNIGGENTDG